MKLKALLQLLSDKLSKLWWYLICCKGYYNSKNISPLLCFLIIRIRNAYTCLFCGIEKRKERRAHAFFATSHILWLEGRGKRLLETLYHCPCHVNHTGCQTSESFFFSTSRKNTLTWSSPTSCIFDASQSLKMSKNPRFSSWNKTIFQTLWFQFVFMTLYFCILWA